MYDLLVANPDVGKDPSVLLYMATKTNPLPANMIQAISQSPFVSTSRTNLKPPLLKPVQRLLRLLPG
jgi:hypothetical protein